MHWSQIPHVVYWIKQCFLLFECVRKKSSYEDPGELCLKNHPIEGILFVLRVERFVNPFRIKFTEEQYTFWEREKYTSNLIL